MNNQINEYIQNYTNLNNPNIVQFESKNTSKFESLKASKQTGTIDYIENILNNQLSMLSSGIFRALGNVE